MHMGDVIFQFVLPSAFILVVNTSLILSVCIWQSVLINRLSKISRYLPELCRELSKEELHSRFGLPLICNTKCITYLIRIGNECGLCVSQIS